MGEALVWVLLWAARVQAVLLAESADADREG